MGFVRYAAGLKPRPIRRMTDSTNHANEDLDAGWDHDVPTPVASIKSLPPTPELEQLDAGWDQQSERSNPKPLVAVSGVHASGTSPPALDSIDEGWDASAVGDATAKGMLGRGKTATLGKKDRRKLERQARAHQVERGLENREQRKAERRELAQQRAASLDAERATVRKKELERKQQKAAKRNAQKNTLKDPQKSLKSEVKPAAAAIATASAVNPSQPTANAPNRAERRAKSSKTPAVGPTRSKASTSPALQSALFGPFTIFIAVILAAALLSYFAFMH